MFSFFVHGIKVINPMPLYRANHLPEFAVDGDTGGPYNFEALDPAPWFVVDLGDTYKIFGIEVFFRPGISWRVAGFKVIS